MTDPQLDKLLIAAIAMLTGWVIVNVCKACKRVRERRRRVHDRRHKTLYLIKAKRKK